MNGLYGFMYSIAIICACIIFILFYSIKKPLWYNSILVISIWALFIDMLNKNGTSIQNSFLSNIVFTVLAFFFIGFTTAWDKDDEFDFGCCSGESEYETE